MFTGRYQAIPAAGEKTIPTTGESMVYSMKSDFLQPMLIAPGFPEEKRQSINDRVNSLQEASDRTQNGFVSRSSIYLSGLTGSLLSPINILAGEAAGVAARPLIARGAGLIGRYLPSEASALLAKPLSERLTKVPEFIGKESIGSLTGKAVSGYAMATGFSVPSEIASTYNPQSDSFNYFGGIKAAAADGGFGLALMAAPYLAGTLWGKLFKGKVDHAEMPLPGEKSEHINDGHIDQAVADRFLKPEQGQWFKDYINKGDTPENLSKRATEMLIQDGHPVDASTNHVMYKILHPDDIDNFNTAVSDNLANNLPDNIKKLYSDFIGHGRVDDMRQNTSVVDGLRGVVSFTRKRLSKLPEEMVNFNKVVRRLLPQSLKEENPFTQHKIYKAEGKGIRTGLTIPSQVEKRLKQDERINRIKQQNRDYQKQFDKTGKQSYQKRIEKNNARITHLEGKLEKILSHENEIKHIQDTLIKDGKVVDNFKSTKEYNRLLDLTRVRNDARALMQELHLRHEYDLHESYATLLDTITKVMRSEFGKFAKPENINDYMRERIQSANPQFKDLEIADVKKEVTEAKETITRAAEKTSTPEGQAKAVESMDEEIKQSGVSETQKEYDEIRSQMDEFKNNDSVFNALIKCVLGTRNV